MRERLGLPPGWVWTTLGELFEWASGGTPKSTVAEFYGGSIPWAVIGDLNDGLVTSTRTTITDLGMANSSAKWVEPGSILLAMYGSIGKLGIAGVRLTTNQAIAFTNPHPIPAKYVFWNLLAHRAELIARGKGGTQQNISQTVIKAFPFALPPLAEQHRIVAEIEKHFTRLDAAVAALERARANLKRYRAAVLKAACEGRLVPTEAELARAEGRDYETGEQLLQRILQERRAKWEAEELAKLRAKGKEPKDDRWKAKYKEPAAPDTSDLPELPEGWVWTTWEQVSRRVTVGHVGPMRHEYVEEGIPFLRSQNVRENRFDWNGLRYISQSFHQRLAKSVVRPGDIAVVRSGSVGVTCVIPEALGEANCADLVVVQQPLGIVPQYGAYYMNSSAKRLIRAGQVGIALTHFNTKSVATLPVPLPPLAEQQRIVAEVERRLSVVEELERQVEASLKRAARLRQAILKRAFAGKLVPQDPNDEPASVLLDRIRAERAAAAAGEPKRRRSRRTTKNGTRSEPAAQTLPLIEAGVDR